MRTLQAAALNPHFPAQVLGFMSPILPFALVYVADISAKPGDIMTDGEVVETPRLIINAANTLNGQNLGILGGAIVAFVVSTNFPKSVCASSFQAAIAVGARLGWQVRGGGHNNTTHTTQHVTSKQDKTGLFLLLVFVLLPHRTRLSCLPLPGVAGTLVCGCVIKESLPPSLRKPLNVLSMLPTNMLRASGSPEHCHTQIAIKNKNFGAGVVTRVMVLAQQGW